MLYCLKFLESNNEIKLNTSKRSISLRQNYQKYFFKDVIVAKKLRHWNCFGQVRSNINQMLIHYFTDCV